MMEKKNNKGQVSGLAVAVLSLVIAVIVLVVGIMVIQEVRDSPTLLTQGANCNASAVTNCPDGYYSTNASLIALGDFSDFVPLIVIGVAASVVIGLILAGFAFRRKSR